MIHSALDGYYSKAENHATKLSHLPTKIIHLINVINNKNLSSIAVYILNH